MENTIKHSIIAAQLCDSAFPIGGFAFSNGLESAIEHYVVTNSNDLKEFTRDILLQSLHSDFITALISFRAATRNCYQEILHADEICYCSKLSSEARSMAIKMGRRASQMGCALFPGNAILKQWDSDIEDSQCKGVHAISTALLFKAANLDEYSLFAALEYGTINITLNAALRIFHISHIETQKLLKELCSFAPNDYLTIKELTLNDMESFAPLYDINSSLHEFGERRLFAN